MKSMSKIPDDLINPYLRAAFANYLSDETLKMKHYCLAVAELHAIRQWPADERKCVSEKELIQKIDRYTFIELFLINLCVSDDVIFYIAQP